MKHILNLSKDGKVLLGVNDKSITEIVVPKGVEVIGDNAFSGSYIEKINIPMGVTSIGKNAFAGCYELTSIRIPDSVVHIDEFAFSDCAFIKEIKIPESVTSIGYGAFSECTKLKHINIPHGLTSLPEEVFRGCTSLKSIDIPENITTIPANAFWECYSLQDIHFRHTDIEKCDIDDDYLFGYIDSLDTCTLHVPEGTAQAYHKHPAFRKFRNIVEENKNTHSGKKRLFSSLLDFLKRWL